MKKFSIILGLFCFIGTNSYCNNYYVTNTNDAGSGSLRAAIDSANLHAGSDSVKLLLTANDTIHLNLSLAPIQENLVVTGQPCQNPTITGHYNDRCFNSYGSTLTINYLNIDSMLSGHGPGAAIVASNIYINYCCFSNNLSRTTASGGAVYADSLWAYHCTFIRNICDDHTNGNIGGGAAGSDNGHFFNCTFIDNTSCCFGSTLGGGIEELRNCYFVSNSNYANFNHGTCMIRKTDTLPINITGCIFWSDDTSFNNYNREIILVDGMQPLQSGGCNIIPDTSRNTNFLLAPSDIWGVDPQLSALGYYGDCVPTINILNSIVAQAHDACGHIVTGVANLIEENKADVYPNPLPAGGWQLTVGENLLGEIVEIFDANGRIVFQSLIASRLSLITVDLSRGVYLMRISSAGGTSQGS